MDHSPTMVNTASYQEIKKLTAERNVTLVAVSKFKPVEDIQALYDLGHRDFGENFVQELTMKYEALPKDIRWHFIGHLQSNKVKYIAPFIHLIHGVDSEKLLAEINKQGAKTSRQIECLLQVHIAMEETKFGFDEDEVLTLLTQINSGEAAYPNVLVSGLMGMASFTPDENIVGAEFKKLFTLFTSLQAKYASLNVLSMGMSGDYKLAIQEGSNMVRIGSLIFGNR